MQARPAPTPTAAADDDVVLTPLALADSLARTALECCRQHERWARLIDHGVPRAERRFGERMRETADDALRTAIQTFERECDRAQLPTELRQKADALWMAAREFFRRQRMSDDDSRQFTQHSADHLAVLRTEFELEASALLALRHATRDYAKLRGDDV